ncbi:MAG TPA: O-antigen ligase family protein [Crocinitomix sp.]|nr:O-antigen ligase family protein [Crocinitomix sp.]
MLKTILHNKWLYVISFLFIVTNTYLIYNGQFTLNVIPIALIVVYIALFHFDKLFIILVFFTPLSINIEEFTNGAIGLFLPTEPILFGMLLILIFNSFFKPIFDRSIILHPVSIIFILQLFWIFFTALFSELPLVSFKFLLTKFWFFIPIYFYGILFFKQKDTRITTFIWLFISALSLVVIYTLVRHASYGFDEETGHWVMTPFFKDHTSYGAILALAYPLIIGLFIENKSPIAKFILIFLLILFGFAIVMSYTRAAWLSLFGAFMVYLLIKFKVKFKYLAFLGFIGILYIAVNWVEIGHALEKNNAEHATENFDERLESMANVTSDASNLERINRWTAAYDLWTERPILGWGPGTYAMVYGSFQRSQNLTIISTSSGNKGNAHSEYLGPLAEQGIIGMLLMLTLVGFIMYYGIIVYLKLPSDSIHKTFVLVSFLALVTYFAHGFLNNYLDTDKATVPVWGLTAYIVMLDIKLRKVY